MAKDPYKLLGVTKSADQKTIKSAYRKLAKKYHPDVNPDAADKFKEITAAYNLLSDPQLKAQYDNGRVDANGQQQNPFGGGFGGGANPFGGDRRGAGGGDMADILESLFGVQTGRRRGASPFGGMGGGPMGGMGGPMGGRPQATRPKRGANIRYRLSISFFDAWTGLNKTIKPKAGGQLTVKIPAGTVTGENIKLAGRGKPSVNGGPRGDAIVEVSVKPHKFFTRDGDKLYLDLPISLSEAVNGAKIPVKLPTGEVNITLPAGERAGQKLRLRGKGIDGGDLIVRPVIQLDPMTINALSATELPKEASAASELRATL